MAQFGFHANDSFQGRRASLASSTSLFGIEACCMTLLRISIPWCTLAPFVDLVGICGSISLAQTRSCLVLLRSCLLHGPSFDGVDASTFLRGGIPRVVVDRSFPMRLDRGGMIRMVVDGFRFSFEPTRLGFHRWFPWTEPIERERHQVDNGGTCVARGHGRTLRRHRARHWSQRMHPQRSPVGQRDEGAWMERKRRTNGGKEWTRKGHELTEPNTNTGVAHGSQRSLRRKHGVLDPLSGETHTRKTTHVPTNQDPDPRPFSGSDRSDVR